jgi:tRNA G10  N-methylase Trm11
MLPPKLAQTIVNLGTGPLTPAQSHKVLDPFCGTGTTLVEANPLPCFATQVKPIWAELTSNFV